MNGISALINKTPESFLVPPTIQGHSKKMPMKPKVGPHQILNLPAPLSWTSQSSGSVKNKCPWSMAFCSLEKTLLLGKIEGKGGGRQRMRWLDGITDSAGTLSLCFGCWNRTACCCSVAVVSDPSQPHGLQHARAPCPSPSPGVPPCSCPLSQ